MPDTATPPNSRWSTCEGESCVARSLRIVAAGIERIEEHGAGQSVRAGRVAQLEQPGLKSNDETFIIKAQVSFY